MYKFYASIFFLTIGTSSIWAEQPPQAVIDAISSDLTNQVMEMFVDRKEDFGFKAEDNIEQMTYGQPFRMHHLDPNLLDLSSKRKSIDTLRNSVEPDIWYSIVLFGGEARALITVNYIQGRYRISAFSADPAVKDLQQLFRVYLPDDVVIFNAPYFHEYYFHTPKKDKTNLTLLNKKGLSDLSPKEQLAKVKSLIGTQSDISTISRSISSRIAARTKQEEGGAK